MKLEEIEKYDFPLIPNRIAPSISDKFLLETSGIVHEILLIGCFKDEKLFSLSNCYFFSIIKCHTIHIYMNTSSEASTKTVASFEPREQAMDTQLKVCVIEISF